jgi:hypothetical protein
MAEYELSGAELDGAYRRLCGAVLVQAALSLGPIDRSQIIGDREAYKRERVSQKSTARRWLEGGVGAITFEEACMALDMDEDFVREGIEKHATSGQDRRRVYAPRRSRRSISEGGQEG